MKKVIKYFACMCITVCLLVGSMAMLVGCGETKESKVMNVDVNPKLEFVLDKDNKVVSVTALNDDGSCILQGDVTFVGLSAEDATKTFLDKAKEYGFVVEADTNALTISISGDGADKLLNDIKLKAESHIETLGLELSVAKEKLNREAMEAIVAKCYGELTSAEIDEKSNSELVDLIKKSRDETKDLLTQDLKDLYYVERAESVMEAKISEIKTQVNAGSNFVKQGLIAGLEIAYNTLDTVYNTVQGYYTSAIQSLSTKMKSYVELKQQYIDARKENNTALIQSLEESVEFAKLALDSARSAIETSIAGIKTTLDNAKELVIEKINEIADGLNMSKIESAINTASTQAASILKNSYSTLNTNPWVLDLQ